jgi:nucleotide-binding universal stress UspA family protein
MVWPSIPGYVEAELPRLIHEIHERRLREESQQAEAQFTDRARRAGIRFEWRSVEGDLTGAATLHARYADLTVVGQGLDVGDAPAGLVPLPEDLVLAVGRPVIVVPRYGRFPTVGERVLIAWNGSREATRAVNDAIPILQRARTVAVLSIDPDEGRGRREPGADIALHLARHGVNVRTTHIGGSGIGVGDVLLSHAMDASADLIVAGAYGHSRLRETVLGGATRHLLQHATVPLFLSH